MKKLVRRKNNDSEEEEQDGVNRILSRKGKNTLQECSLRTEENKQCKTEVGG